METLQFCSHFGIKQPKLNDFSGHHFPWQRGKRNFLGPARSFCLYNNDIIYAGKLTYTESHPWSIKLCIVCPTLPQPCEHQTFFPHQPRAVRLFGTAIPTSKAEQSAEEECFQTWGWRPEQQLSYAEIPLDAQELLTAQLLLDGALQEERPAVVRSIAIVGQEGRQEEQHVDEEVLAGMTDGGSDLLSCWEPPVAASAEEPPTGCAKQQNLTPCPPLEWDHHAQGCSLDWELLDGPSLEHRKLPYAELDHWSM